jgi:hypothetical protein
MRKVMIVALAAVLLLPLSSTAFAAKGGGDGNAGSSIALAQVSGAAGTVPALGSTVAFATTYPSYVKNPRIEVLCYQNGALVYGEAGGVTESFLLGGGGSVWLWNGGGPADCTTNLFYFGMHAGSQTYNLLASTSFGAN